jgi:hypothetical protein
MSSGPTVATSSDAAVAASGSTVKGHPMTSPLAIKLLASPVRLTMKERAKFMVGVEVTNHGETTAETHLATGCTLTVNGQPALAWNLAIGNGAREPSWYELPPGQTVSLSWPLGEALFDKPGDYHLVMTLGQQQASADVEVTP